MGRIFTTSFEFNHQRYDAIVTMITHGRDVNIHVKLLDEDLRHFIPEGELSFSGNDGFERLQALNNTVAQSIMQRLGKAINQHLVDMPL